MSSPGAAFETIRIETRGRHDALDLARRLGALHTYLVQLGDLRWLVCVRCAAGDEELLARVRAAAESWARERDLDAVLRVGGAEHALSRE